jgi:gas vesicle protein GvpA/GvpJ/GvpM family
VSTPSLAGSGVSRDDRPIALVDLLDRLIGTGVVLAGDVVISLAGVDLVELRLRALLRTVEEHEGDV